MDFYLDTNSLWNCFLDEDLLSSEQSTPCYYDSHQYISLAFLPNLSPAQALSYFSFQYFYFKNTINWLYFLIVLAPAIDKHFYHKALFFLRMIISSFYLIVRLLHCCWLGYQYFCICYLILSLEQFDLLDLLILVPIFFVKHQICFDFSIHFVLLLALLFTF